MAMMEVSHMTLLIVTLAFSLVNICLIIATGGIIYNWQDRFVGPVLACQQPKWTSDGRNRDNVRVGTVRPDNTNTNTNTGYNNNVNSNWGGVSANVNGYDASASVGGNVNTNVNNQYANTWYTAAASGIIGSSAWSSWKDNAWSSCPIIAYPRWSTWTQPTQTWTTWTQPTAWVSQPTAWTAWTQPIVQPAWIAVPQPTAWIAVAQPTAWIAVAQPTAWIAQPSWGASLNSWAVGVGK